MEIILLKKVQGLGNLGDLVKVKKGFARNYLIPQDIAKTANKANLEDFKSRKAQLEKKEFELLQEAKVLSKAMEKLEEVAIKSQATDEGRLFGSIGQQRIAEELKKLGFNVQKNQIRMPEGSIKNLGNYKFDVQLHADVFLKIKVKVSSTEES